MRYGFHQFGPIRIQIARSLQKGIFWVNLNGAIFQKIIRMDHEI